MTRKRFSKEDILNILHQVELDLASGKTVDSAIRTAGVSDATYFMITNVNRIAVDHVRLARDLARARLGMAKHDHGQQN